MIQYPNISPEIFRLGPIAPRWYGLMYVVSFIIGGFIIYHWLRKEHQDIAKDDFYDLVLYIMLGVILGGRLGYVIFYNLEFFLTNPLQIINVTGGGMSFHGGFIGVILGMLYFARKKKLRFYNISDVVVIAGALGLGFGRIGNFLNAELYGRITSVNWCMYFPADPENCRHPSQLYESFLEGFLLFAILWFVKSKNPPKGVTSWLFVAGYGLSRFIVEFVREPDAHIGLELLGATRGQLLSLPMLIVGVGMIIWIFVTDGAQQDDQKEA